METFLESNKPTIIYFGFLKKLVSLFLSCFPLDPPPMVFLAHIIKLIEKSGFKDEGFDEEGVEEKLFKETMSWLRKYEK